VVVVFVMLLFYYVSHALSILKVSVKPIAPLQVAKLEALGMCITTCKNR
jgi:hypothetical protein